MENLQNLNSEFTLVVGPMGGRKTTEMLLRAYKKDEEGKHVVGVKHVDDPRGPYGVIASRIEGLSRQAVVLRSLGDFATSFAQETDRFTAKTFEEIGVIAIDELMFFRDAEVTYQAIFNFLSAGKIVIASSLDYAGNGNKFPTIKRIEDLKPNIEPQFATCKKCQNPEGRYTRVYDALDCERPYQRQGLPFYLPDDGVSRGYQAHCRACFFEEDNNPNSVVYATVDEA